MKPTDGVNYAFYTSDKVLKLRPWLYIYLRKVKKVFYNAMSMKPAHQQIQIATVSHLRLVKCSSNFTYEIQDICLNLWCLLLLSFNKIVEIWKNESTLSYRHSVPNNIWANCQNIVWECQLLRLLKGIQQFLSFGQCRES